MSIFDNISSLRNGVLNINLTSDEFNALTSQQKVNVLSVKKAQIDKQIENTQNSIVSLQTQAEEIQTQITQLNA